MILRFYISHRAHPRSAVSVASTTSALSGAQRALLDQSIRQHGKRSAGTSKASGGRRNPPQLSHRSPFSALSQVPAVALTRHDDPGAGGYLFRDHVQGILFGWMVFGFRHSRTLENYINSSNRLSLPTMLAFTLLRAAGVNPNSESIDLMRRQASASMATSGRARNRSPCSVLAL